MDLIELLKFVTKKEASDLHLKPGRPPLLRLSGRLVPLKTDPLSPKEIEDMVLPILTPYQRDKLQANYAVDIGYGVTGVARFRGNIYLQRGSWTAVFRRIPFVIPSLVDLNLPDILSSFADLPAGFVLVTGPTGSGKSTTLASLVKLITERHPVHIVTIEDPIEYLFQDNMASVSQREMGTDTTTYQEALRNVMRQDPDVIMVGEMRDWETMSTAITAVQAGVVGSLADLVDTVGQQAQAAEGALIADADRRLVERSRAVLDARTGGQGWASRVGDRAACAGAGAGAGERSVQQSAAAADAVAVRGVRCVLNAKVEPGDLRRQIHQLRIVIFITCLAQEHEGR